jgi:signal recognition particle GTPase
LNFATPPNTPHPSQNNESINESRIQAEVWRDEVGVTGVIVTKLDGTARAG